MALQQWNPPTTKAVSDEALDCFHVHVGDSVFASHLDENDARAIERTMNSIGPVTEAAREVVHVAYMAGRPDIALMDSIAKLARVLEAPAATIAE